MRKLKFLLIMFVLFVSFGMLRADKVLNEEVSNFNLGFVFKAGSMNVNFNDSKTVGELGFLTTGFKVNLDISDYITLSFIAGYQQNHFNNSLNVTGLPLSLNLPEENAKSMVFGFIIESEPFSIDYFSLGIDFEFDYYKSFSQAWAVKLPVIEGVAQTKNSFYTANLSFLFKYDGFSSLTPFIGPNLNMIAGTVSVSEKISDIEESIDMKYRQKNIIGLTSGVKFELGDNWDIELRLNLFSEKTLGLTVLYIL